MNNLVFQNIFERIMQLNLGGSLITLHQVDSETGFANSVTIQVAGTITQNAETRRFMQTFILGQHAAFKYYVHNSIFRYQDYSADQTVAPAPAKTGEKNIIIIIIIVVIVVIIILNITFLIVIMLCV